MADQAQPPPPREKAARRTPTPRKTPAPGVEGEDDPYVGLRILDQIEVRKPIGVGSMARVYQAFQHGVDRDVAVKILHRELSDNPDIVARFHREAQVACLLDHPNAVKVMLTSQLPARDKGAGELVLVMEYLRGRTLAEALAEGGGRLPLERALHVLVQICDVVGEAHRRGVVHRDIKPENVMLVERGDEPDFVKVLDFGIARLAAKDASYATRQGAVFGSPRYISPEGAQGMTVTPAADVYSLATLFFQCLAGRTPFEADTPVALLVAHATEEAPLLSSLPGCEKVPAPLVELLQKNLAKEAEERDPDASALGRALARAACAAGLKPDPVALRLGWLEVVADSPSRDAFSPELRARIEAGGRGSPGLTIVADLEEPPYEPGGKTTTLFDVPSSAAVRDDKRAEPRRGAPGPTIVLDEVDASGRPVSARTSGRASTTIIIDPHDDRPGIKPNSGRGVIPAVVGHSAGLAPVHTPAPPTSPPYFNNHLGDLGSHSHSHPGAMPNSVRHHGGPPQGPPSQGHPQHPQHPPHAPPPQHAQHAPHPQQHTPQPPHAHPSQHTPQPPHAHPSHPSHPNHDPAFRPNAALSSTPGSSLPTSPSQAPDEPRRRYGLIMAIVGIFFVFGGALTYAVRFGLRRGDGSAAEALLTEVHRAEQRGAWLEPPGQNVRELLQRAQRDLPGDGRVYDLRRSLAARALELARSEREAARHAEALRFAELAREFDPANRDAGELIKALTLAPPEVVVPPAPPPVAPPTLASAPAPATGVAPPAAPPTEAVPPAPPPEASAAAGKGPRPPSSGRSNPGGTTRPPSDNPKPGGRAGASSGADPWLLARVSRNAGGRRPTPKPPSDAKRRPLANRATQWRRFRAPSARNMGKADRLTLRGIRPLASAAFLLALVPSVALAQGARPPQPTTGPAPTTPAAPSMPAAPSAPAAASAAAANAPVFNAAPPLTAAPPPPGAAPPPTAAPPPPGAAPPPTAAPPPPGAAPAAAAPPSTPYLPPSATSAAAPLPPFGTAAGASTTATSGAAHSSSPPPPPPPSVMGTVNGKAQPSSTGFENLPGAAWRPFTKAELSLGALTLPRGDFSLPTQDSAKRADLTLLLTLRQLFQWDPHFAIGAALDWGLRPVSDEITIESARGPIKRSHSRNYLMVTGLVRYIPVVRPGYEIWLAASGGALIVSDRYQSQLDKSALPVVVGPQATNIGTEGGTVGLGAGLEYRLDRSWALGGFTQQMLWFLPERKRQAQTTEASTVGGRLFSFEVGLTATYRARL